jgi:hypothetical protein
MAEVGNELALYIQSLLLNLNEVKQAHTGFWWGVIREKDHLEGLGIDGLVCCMAEVGNELALYIRSLILNLNEMKQAHTGFWWGVLREKYHLEDLGIDSLVCCKAEVGNELAYIRSPVLNLNEVKQAHTGFWWGVLRGKRPLGRPGLRWQASIKMVLYGLD